MQLPRSGARRAGAGGQQPGPGGSSAWCAPHTPPGPVCLAGIPCTAAADASSVAFGQTQVLDTGSLLRSCVQSAVGMLRDQHAGRQRGMRRVQVLLGLLQDDAGEGPVAGPRAPPAPLQPPTRGQGTAGPRRAANVCPLCFVAAAFSRVAKMRLHHLLKKQEETYVSHMKQWVAREAANPDALQEAGTFRYRGWPEAPGGAAPWGSQAACRTPHTHTLF